MARRKRWGLTSEQKAELWRRWQQGQSFVEIARVLDRVPATVHRVVSLTGGFAPPPRYRSARVLGLSEREEISRGLACGHSLRQIARNLGRAPSTISRELARHGGRAPYRAARADQCAWERARRPKPCRLARHRRLQRRVSAKLMRDWSPQQIAGWLKRRYPGKPSMHISHETIYRSLFIQARGALKKELMAHLRSRKRLRRTHSASGKDQGRGRLAEMISIRERPAEVEDRAVPGHWEGDLISGANNSHIATLVERHSRFVLLVKVKGKDTHSVVSALTEVAHTLPRQLRRSLTWDQGKEMANHKQFSLDTNIDVYFCDPRSPWQRGSNENTNGLLRQYFPKGTNLSTHSQARLDQVAELLNTRPRQTLQFMTPAEKLQETVALTD